MNRLLALAGFRYWLGSPSQLILALVSVALGVAVVVAVQLANQSAFRGFQLTTHYLSSGSNYQLTGGQGGVPQHWYTRLKVNLGIEHAAPQLDGSLHIKGRMFQLVGVAPLAETSLTSRLAIALSRHGLRLMVSPDGVLMSRSTANRLGLVKGQYFKTKINGRIRKLRLIAYLRGRGDQAIQGIIITDIANAQRLLGKKNVVTRIDLRLNVEQLAKLRSALPPTLHLVTVRTILDGAARMTKAFRLNLTAMSLLSLLVGAYLIYNALAFSVLRRRSLISLLRAQGVTRHEILRGVLTEAGALAATGAVIGMIVGVWLGHGLVHLVTRTMNDFYFKVTVTHVYLNPWLFLAGLVLAIGVSLLAALAPALEALNLAPRGHTEVVSSEKSSQRRGFCKLLSGFLLIAGGAAVLMLSQHRLMPAFAALFMMLMGLSLWMPLWLRLFAGVLSRFSRMSSVPVRLPLTEIVRSVDRTGPAVAALAIALAVSIGVALMVSSFRGAVVDWLHETLQGDYYITAASHHDRLPLRVAQQVERLPGVERVTTRLRRTVQNTANHGFYTVLALHSSTGTHPSASVKKALPGAWQAFETGHVIFVSESLAYRQGLSVGDAFKIPTAQGIRACKIGAIVRSYGNAGHGLVMMSRGLYERFWPTRGMDSLAVYLRPGESRYKVSSALHYLLAGEGHLRINSNRSIMHQSLHTFDQTFAITRVLRWLLLGVALVGMVASLMALELVRVRTHATLRVLGMTPREMLGMIMGETLVLGLASGLAALPVGYGLAWMLTQVINPRAFGWTLPLHLSLDSVAQGLLAALAAALLAGIYPAWRITRVSPVRALRAE